MESPSSKLRIEEKFSRQDKSSMIPILIFNPYLVDLLFGVVTLWKILLKIGERKLFNSLDVNSTPEVVTCDILLHPLHGTIIVIHLRKLVIGNGNHDFNP